MARNEWYNITSFNMSGVAYTGIKMVAIERAGRRITDSSDNDTDKSFQAVTDHDTTVEVDCVDPVQAIAIKNAAQGTLAFVGAPAGGNANGSSTSMTVTVLGTVFNRFGMGARYGAFWSNRLSGGAVNNGQNPVSVVAA